MPRRQSPSSVATLGTFTSASSPTGGHASAKASADDVASRRAGSGAGAERAALVTRALSYADELRAYAGRLTRCAFEADDILQETYVRALLRLEQLRDVKRCRAWLFCIARSVCFDRARGRRRRHLVPVVDELFADDQARTRATAAQLRPDLERALATLPDVQREALLLCDVWEFRYAEIAEIVDAPLGTVRSRIARGRAALHRALAGPASGASR